MIPLPDENPGISMIRTGILQGFRDFLEYSAPDLVNTAQKQKYSRSGRVLEFYQWHLYMSAGIVVVIFAGCESVSR
jgi:hypothetical protein